MITKSKLFFDSVKSLCCIIGIYGLIIVPAMSASLPSGYTELEYLQSNGTQYIDTGLTPSQANTVEVKASIANVSVNTYMAGARNSSGKAVGYSVCFSAHNYLTFYPTAWGSNDIGLVISNDEVFTTKSKISASEQYLITNGVSKYAVAASRDIDGSVAITLFALHNENNTTVDYSMSGKMYYSKMWQEDSLVRNFIPAKRNSDGVLGMYDTVSNTFFTNAGTGTFIAGPVVDIQIATTKYVETAFADSVNELNTTMGTIKNVVDNTIIQADRIGKLATGKQTRPAENCPDGAQCLLITEADGSLHWYPICDENGNIGTQSSN